jgi:secondary thiamine-phosphate synthase enzyme
VETAVLKVRTHGRRFVDLTAEAAAFVAPFDADGLLHLFAPHATAGLALFETGAGTEPDLESAIERLFPRDDRYAHRHGSVGHGADHVLPAFICPSLVVPVLEGGLALGPWQSVVFVDPNRENDVRTVRLSFLRGSA